jgi:hypothetical protein
LLGNYQEHAMQKAPPTSVSAVWLFLCSSLAGTNPFLRLHWRSSSVGKPLTMSKPRPSSQPTLERAGGSGSSLPPVSAQRPLRM